VRPVALPQPARRGSTGAFERLRALPEHRVVDRLLRGRAWIWLIGLMLGGIVAMQVSLLGLNAGISANVEKAGTLERVNADLETQVARLSSGARIRHTAQEEGMVAPPAGEVTFLTARPADDARLAAGRMQPPSDEARQVMATGGRPIVPPAPTTTLAPAAGDVAPVLATDPVLPEAAPVATPAPVATAVPTPAPTAAPEAQVPAATGTGVTTAPAG
jgi:cell division protein FtsB